jgi:diguanylate cyclase (GGDEF)-like protein
MMVDIDYFKTLNDEFGHDIGDKWLVQFSKIMKAHLRSDDEVIRYGGEEFLIILRNVDPAFLPAIAVKLKEGLGQIDKEMKNPQMKRTCSIGYSQFPFYNDVPMHLSFEEVVLLADLALYYAKKNGRNMAVQLVPGEAKPDREQTEKMTASLEFGIANRFYLIHPLR